MCLTQRRLAALPSKFVNVVLKESNMNSKWVGSISFSHSQLYSKTNLTDDDIFAFICMRKKPNAALINKDA